MIQLAKQILLVDIQKDPIDYLQKLESVVLHSMMLLTSIKYGDSLTKFDPSVQQADLKLRDIVFILVSSRDIIRRLN